MLELVGYRDEHRDLVTGLWRGALLVSSGPAGPLAPPAPEPDPVHAWRRVLVAPGRAVVVYDEIDYVHRSAKLSVAALADAAEVLAAAASVATGRLRLHRVHGTLADTDTAGAKAAYEAGFTPELSIPAHVWHDGAARAGTVWGRCSDAA